MIEVYSKDHILRCVASSANGHQEKELQGDNKLQVTFTLYEYVQLDVNDYVDFLGERYWLMERYKPKMKNSKEWEYSLDLYGIESLVKRFLVINYTDSEDTPIFTLTAPASEHAKIILASINKAMGQNLFKLGEVKQTENLVIDYNGTYCNDALDLLGKAAKTEYWFENGTTLNISKAQYGEELTLGYGKGLISLERQKAENVRFYSRLFPMGSTKNIDPTRYGHNRLQLPNGQKWIDKDVDKYGVVHHFEEAAFANIYPRRIGVVSAVRQEQRTSKDGKPFEVYYIKDKDLNFNPNEYKIGGNVMRIAFQEGSELAGQGTSEEHYFEVNYADLTKEFEIITLFPSDDMQVPGGLLVPKIGDKYILSHLRMPDEYYPLAEQELLAAVQKFNEENFVDNSVYKGDTDHVWVEQQKAELFVGRRVRLESAEYFAPIGYRLSRITKISRTIDLPSLVSLEISDAIPKGKIASIEGNIKGVRQYVVEATSTIPDVIGNGDDIKPGEHNVYSAKRSDKSYLSKTKADTAKGNITFEKGISFNKGYEIKENGDAVLNAVQLAGFEENVRGFKAWLDEQGKSHIQVDFFEAMVRAAFHELEVRRMIGISGDQMQSNAASVLLDAIPILTEGKVLAWKCHLKTDDGTTQIFNTWAAGDQAFCQTSNLRQGLTKDAANRTYWRVVADVKDKTDSEEAYIILSNEAPYYDDKRTDAPQAGDSVVQFGHNAVWDLAHGIDTATTANRMNVNMQTTSGGSPVSAGYRAISSFNYSIADNAVFYLSAGQVFLRSNRLKWISESGAEVPNVLYMGDWKPGTKAHRYETYTYNGSTRICLMDTTDEPSDQSAAWGIYAAKGGSGLRVEGFSSAGSAAFTEGQTDWRATFELHVWENDIETTDTLPTTRFRWTRVSEYSAGDTAWNGAHENIGNTLSLTYDDLKGDTSFICAFLSADGNDVLASRTF